MKLTTRPGGAPEKIRRRIAWTFTIFLALFAADGLFDVILGVARGSRHMMAAGGDLMLGTAFCWIIGALAYGGLRWAVALARWRPFEREIEQVRDDLAGFRGEVHAGLTRIEDNLTGRGGPSLAVVVPFRPRP